MKPADFFIDVVDFFSILLPGALVANALVPIAKSSSFQIINNQNESLLLLAVK